MGINSENNNNTENLKQQENLASAVDGVTSSAQQLASANTKVADSTRDMRDGIDSTTDKLDKMQEGLDKTLRSIHLLPAAIEEYTKTINKNMAYAREDLQEGFFKGILNEKLWGFRAELGRETEELKQAMEASKKSALQAIEHANKTGKEQDKQIADAAKLRAQQLETAYQNRKNMKFSQQLNIKLARDMKTQLLEIGKKMFSDLWGYAKKLLDDAYSKDKSTIEQNYDTIMSMNSYNHGEYAKLIDRLQEKIDASGLGDVISVNTLQENLTKTMQMGLQGALAESNAYYASIAEKAGITFDWYGTEWTNLISQMNRTGKDYEKVMKSVIATTDDLAEVYGDSTGLAGGRANQMMSAASTLGTTYGLSEEAIGNIYKSLAVTSQELTNYGIDTTNFVQDITGALESGLSNKDLGVIFGTGGASGAEVEAKIKAGRFDELMLQYMDNLEAMYKGQNSEMVNALQGALGSSFSNTDYQAFQTYWEQEGSFSANFEKAMGASNSDIEDINGELKNYVTTQESYETKMENSMAGIAEWMVQNPIAEVLAKNVQSGLASIIQLLSIWVGNQALNKFLGGGSGGDSGQLMNLLKNSKMSQSIMNSFGGSGGVLKNAGAAKSLFSEGYKFKDVASVAGNGGATLGKIGQVVGKVAPWASIAAGAAIGISDSVSAGKSAKENWDTYTTAEKNAAIANTGLAFLTGHNANISHDEKMQKAINGELKIDWGEAAKNVGKGALIGGGAGMLASPIGGAIGAAAGAISGFATNLIQQAVDMKDYKDLVNSEEFKRVESLRELNKVQSESTQKLQAYAETVKTLDEASAQLDTEEKARAQGKGKLTELELAQLKMKVQLLEIENKQKLAELGSSADVIKNTDEQLENGRQAQQTMDFIEQSANMVKELGIDAETKLASHWTSDNMTDKGREVAKKALQNEDFKKSIRQMVDNGSLKGIYDITGYDANGSPIYSKDLNMEKMAIAALQLSTTNHKGYDFADVVETDAISYTSMKGGLNSAFYNSQKDAYNQAMTNMSDNISTATTLTSALSANTKYSAVRTGIAQAAHNYINSLRLADATLTEAEAIEKMKTDLPITTLLSSWSKDDIKKYQDWLVGQKDIKVDGYYATGTNYVPYDNYLALLHRGEQVKTSAEVALDEAKHVASTNTQSAIHDVVLNQTNTIINLLTNIYQVLSSGRASPAKLSTKIKYDLPGAT